jgi:hypothetical protein
MVGASKTVALKRALRKSENGLPLFDSPQFSSSVHWTPAEKLPIHRWFRYREGFSPKLFDFFAQSRSRLDPFCGCGTTLLESARQGVQSFGIDLNPLATFVAKVKTQAYSAGDRRSFVTHASDGLASYRRLKPATKPAYPLLSKLFQDESMDTLLRMKHFIEDVEEGKVRDLLMLVWLSILEDASNTFKEGNGLKYRNKRRRPGTYATIPTRVWKRAYFGRDIRQFVEALWVKKCGEIAGDLEAFQFPKGYTPEIRTGSCLQAGLLDFGAPVDLAIFSPPYANRFDYFEAFKIELWMGGFVKTSTDMAKLRAGSVRNNLAASRFSSDERWSALRPFIDQMDEDASSVRMGIKPALEGYFYDMRRLLRQLRDVLRRKGKAVVVVGNSAYAKSIIPTDALLARIGQEEGYAVKGIHVARHLHVSSQQRSTLSDLEDFMRESVVVLEKIH